MLLAIEEIVRSWFFTYLIILVDCFSFFCLLGLNYLIFRQFVLNLIRWVGGREGFGV